MTNRPSVANRQRFLRVAKRPLLIVLLVSAMLGALGAVEVTTDAPVGGAAIAYSAPGDLFSSAFQEVPVDTGGLPSVDPGALPGPEDFPSIDPGAFPEIPDIDPGVGEFPEFDDPNAVLAYAQSLVNAIVGEALGAGGGGVGAQSHLGPVDPLVQAVMCPILLQARAQVIAVTNALIAVFPQLAAQLLAIQAAAVAIIDAQLEQFHCGVVSP